MPVRKCPRNRASFNRLFNEARATGQMLLVIFADASIGGPITHFAQLVEVVVDGDKTHYTVAGIRRLKEPVPQADVIVVSTDSPISVDDIRSYRICKTPEKLLR